MRTVSIREAQAGLSRLVTAMQSDGAADVIIMENGVPVARLAPIRKKPKIKWGLAKGKFIVPKSIDFQNTEIEALFRNN